MLHGEDRRASMTQVLDAMAADGLTVGRQWVVGEGDPGVCGPVQGASLFRYGPEVFFEDSYHQLDRLLAEARQRGIRLVLTLGNNWGDHGGIPMYLRWAGLPATDPEAFWSDPRLRAFYLAGVDHLLERRNSVTGVRYVDDPTILSWELMNESTTLTPEGAAARRVWITEMARHIKAKDANHLVAAGLLGYSILSERREWVAVHQLPEIDYCDSHLYPQDDQQVMGWERLRDVIDDRAQLARFVVGKPLVLGEFGFRTSGAASWLGLPRAEWFSRLSSEWPEPRNGGSPLRVLLDGQEVGARSLVPDDGLGRVEAVTVAGPGLLRSLAGGVHTLTFEVPETVAPHGLRIYGRPAAPTRPPPGAFVPIELAILRKP